MYYAIKHNMNGILYLLIEKGFEDISNFFDCLVLNDIQLFLNLIDKSEIKQIK